MAAENEELNFVINAKDRTARALNNVKQRTDRADRSAQNLNSQFGKMKNLIGGLAAGAAFQQLGSHIVQTTQKVRGFRRETAKVMDLSGQEMSGVVTQAKAITDTFGEDYEQVIKAANTASKRFGMTAQEALTKIEKGLMRGGTQADDFLKQIHEYSGSFKEAGFNADQFFGTVTQGAKMAAFQDKLPDAIKEFSLAIREQTKPVREALNEAFSEDFADSIVGNVKDGSMSAKEALMEIDEQIERTNPDVKAMQMLTADLFKGPGEDVGQEFLRNIEEATTALSDQKDEFSDLNKQQQKMLRLNKELSQSQVDFEQSTREFGNTFQDVWKNIQIGFWNALNDINRGLQELGAGPEKARKIEQSRARESIQENQGKWVDGKFVSVRAQARKKKASALEEDIGSIKGTPDEEFRRDALKNKQQVLENRRKKLKRRREELKEEVEWRSSVLEKVAPGAVEEFFTGGTRDPVSDKRGFGSKVDHLKEIAGRESQDPAAVSARLRLAMIKRMRAKGELQALKQGKTSIKSELKKLEADDRASELNSEPGDGSEGGGGEPQLENRAQTIRAQAPKSFKINIENLIREFEIQAETVDEGAEELESKVVGAVLRALNNAQSADNNGGG